MSRLTIKNSDGTYSQPTHTTFEKMFWKVSELEDLMEKYHCNDIVALENMLQENTELKKKLENAIVPKFKIGQEVHYYHIARNKLYSGVVEDIQWFALRIGVFYRIPNLQRDYFWIREDELFATKEQAEQRLKELKVE